MNRRFEGIICLFLAASFMGSNGIWLRLESGRLPFYELVGFRFILAFVIVASLARLMGKSLRTKALLLESLMGLTGGLLVLSYFFAIESLGISVAALLLYTAPIFAAFLSHFLIGERLNSRALFSILIAFVGVVLILKPSFGMSIDLLVGLSAGLLFGFKIVLNRVIGKVDSTWVMTFFYFLIPSVFFTFAFALLPSAFVMPSSPDILPIAGLVILASVFGLLLEHHGLIIVPAAEGSVILMFEAVAATLFGIVFFQERLDVLSALGGILIIISGASLNSKIITE